MPDEIATNLGITQNRPPRPYRAPAPDTIRAAIRTAAPMPSECCQPRPPRPASPATACISNIPPHDTAPRDPMRRCDPDAIRAPNAGYRAGRARRPQVGFLPTLGRY